MTGRPGEDGYALVAAVASIAVFAGLALAIATATRTAIDEEAGVVRRAQAAAAADAGVALGIAGLAGGWSLDGRPHAAALDTARLSIRLVDERGKVPVNRLDAGLAERLLAQAGVGGARLAVARDSLLDWLDEDDEARPEGAELPFYAERGPGPRNGALASVGELARVRGFDDALVRRLAPFVTVAPGAASFDPAHAGAFAIGVMSDGGTGGVEQIERAREAAGQRTALAFTQAPETLVGRPVTVAVDADVPGGYAHREALVELTGSPRRPYVVRGFR